MTIAMPPFHAPQAERALESLKDFFGRPHTPPAPTDPTTRVLSLFARVSASVPAYRAFLEERGIDPASIDSLEAFSGLPTTSKENYYRRYPLADLCEDGALHRCDMMALSSGSTGEAAAWPRFVSDELSTALRFEQILDGAFDARRRKTLAVVCFALGNWVGGLFTIAACRHVAAKGYPLSVIAPGNAPPEIFRALRTLGDHYEQIVLLGYPPFLKDVIDLGRADGWDWARRPVRLVMAGEVFSEAWRTTVCRRLGDVDPLHSTASLYGTADAGVLANETPLSIAIRRALSERPDVARTLFGESRLPTLCQYDPGHRYFEALDGSLVFSGDGGAPLVRYDILDRGGVVEHDRMRQFCADHRLGLDPSDGAWTPRLPFVFVFGRSHFAVSFYGANVFPENVSAALEQPRWIEHLTGKFVLGVEHDPDGSAELDLVVELARGVSATSSLARDVSLDVRDRLEQLNSEFAHYAPAHRRSPRVTLRPFADPEVFPKGVKHRYTR